MKVKALDMSGAQLLWKELAWTLTSHGDVEVKGESIILKSGSIISVTIWRSADIFEIELMASPNIAGVNDMPVHIYPRNLILPRVEDLKTLLVETVITVKQAILVLVLLSSMELLRNPRYVGVTINIDRYGDGYKPVSYKVIVNVGGIGYEIAVSGGRKTYRITFSSLELFKAFAEVVLPEFLASRGEAKE
jgi:hypothetical protein